MIDFRVSFVATPSGGVKITLLINGVPEAVQFIDNARYLANYLNKPDGNYTIYLTEPSR